MTLEIDHLFCFVDPGADWAARATSAGWVLTEGTEHTGQGTRNRCLWFSNLYLEFIWLSSRSVAEKNPVRLDRRADWRITGACPFGIGLRGQIDEALRSEFWEYRPPYAPQARIWIHRSNESEPAAPLLFLVEVTTDAVERSRRRTDAATVERISLLSPRPVNTLVKNLTPKIVWRSGTTQSLEIVVGDAPGRVLNLTDEISLVG